MATIAPGSSEARTWRVTPDGTGDAPSIEAAMDSAAALDTVLVAPGEHVITQVEVTDGIFLVGEEGPLQTRLVPYPNPSVLSRLYCAGLDRPTEISGLWLDGFGLDGFGAGAIADFDCVDLRVLGCVFTNNATGIAVDTDLGLTLIDGNTFVNNTIGINIESGAGTCVNNIIWCPAQGLQQQFIICNDVLQITNVPPQWRSANFSLDPQFCGGSADYYYITASSPCAPGNSPLGDDCGLIGALPVNCTSTPVEESTWGRIKALYWKRP